MTGWLWWWVLAANILLPMIRAQASGADCIETLVHLSDVEAPNKNKTISLFRDNRIDQKLLFDLDNFQDTNFFLEIVGIKSLTDRLKIYKCFNLGADPESPCQLQSPCGSGQCVYEDGEYTCRCVTGFTGPNCRHELDECASSPCLNGSTCVDHVNNYTCSCPEGFYGRRCETDRNECVSGPCSHGTCMDIVNGYECDCHNGYGGTLCDEEINECLSLPCQHGKCHDHVGRYSCHCHRGYKGTNCDVDIDDCASGPCRNKGTCQDHINNYTCHCAVGYDGRHCENLWLTKDSFSAMDMKLESSLNMKTSRSAAYVRWGRLDCPPSASLVYTGISAGSYHTHAGAGSNMLCLHSQPVYNSSQDFVWGSPTYGVSFSLKGKEKPYSATALEGKVAPCAVCLAEERTTTIMIPARDDCPVGWSREYFGYLMAPQCYNDKKGEYICMDNDPQGIDRVGSVGHRLTPSSVDTGYGMNAPYVDARELTCSVCSK